MGQDLVEVVIPADTDDLVTGVTAAVVVFVAFAVIFYVNYIVCVAVDVAVVFCRWCC